MTSALPALFGAALLGAATVVGLALSALGAAPLLAYLLVLTVATALLVRRSRAARHTARRTAGRTCDCCTSTVYDPVTVVEERAR